MLPPLDRPEDKEVGLDKKSIIIIVILAILVIFYWPILTKLGFIEPPEEPIPSQQGYDTAATATARQDTAPAVGSYPTDYRTVPETQLVEQQVDTAIIDTLVVQTGKYQITLSTFGGGPVSIQLKDYTYRDGRQIEMLPNLVQVTPEVRFGGGTFTTSREHFTCNLRSGEYDATRQPVEVVYTYSPETGGTIERRFVFYPDRHSFDFSLKVDDPVRFGFEREYQLVWNTALEPTEPNLSEDWGAMQAATMMGGSRETLDDFNDNVLRQSLDGSVTWAGVRSKYFAAVLIPRNRNAEGVFANGLEDDISTPDGMLLQRRITAGVDMVFAAVSPIADSFTVFVGPLDYMMMAEYDVGLEDMLDIGTMPYVGWIIKPFAIGIMWILPKLYSAIPNYGIVIILFALMVKIITLPLSMKSFKSMQAMKELQPKIEEIKKRHKKDPQKVNQETMKMYKAHGVNPLSGCLPMLPQMPLFFALFSVFRSTILLRDAPFFWFINDLH